MRRLLFLLIPCLLIAGCQFPGESRGFSETEFLMDTVCTIRSDSETAIKAGFDAVRAVQDATDFFRGSSTVSVFNRADAGVPVPLDTHTETILQTALKVSEASGGRFDVTIAPASALWNFAEGKTPPTQEKMAEALPLIGYQNLVLDTEKHTLTKTRAGVMINLGGCAKGYGADLAKKAMLEAGATWGVLDLGGNIVVFGENPNRKDGSWEIGVQEPEKDTGAYARTISLEQTGAVVTSGTYQRKFSYGGRVFHHILDPATGFPAETETKSATVTCDSALTADCLSTACLILGREKGTALAESFDATVYFIT